MARRRTDSFLASVEALLSEKEALAATERRLIGTLNSVLNKIGYQVLPVGAEAPGATIRRARGRPRVRRVGGKPVGPQKSSDRPCGRAPKVGARRRGRPPKERPSE